MISKRLAKILMKVMKTNTKRLVLCEHPHDFSIRVSNKSWQCTKCNGVVDRQSKTWYERGLKHGKKSMK